MSNLYHAKITDFKPITKPSPHLILPTDYFVLDDKTANYITTINSLSSAIERTVLVKNETIKKTWTFKRLPYVENFDPYTANLSSIVPKWYVDDLHKMFIDIIDNLSSYIYNQPPHIPSKIGETIVVSYLDTAQKVADIYGGKASNWQQIGKGCFIASANPSNNQYTNGVEKNSTNNHRTLTAANCPLEEHDHSFSSSVKLKLSSNKNTPGFYTNQSGSKSGHKSSGGFQGINLITIASSVKVSAHINGTTEAFSKAATKDFDERPPYIALYLWRRIS